MNKILATFIKCKKLYVSGQVYNENNPDPTRLAGILGNCGYAMSPELKGWISPDYEEELIKTLGSYLEQIYGYGKVWKSVYISPSELPDSKFLQRIDQVSIYLCPEVIDDIREEQTSDSWFWETNKMKIESILGKGGEDDLEEAISGIISSPLPLGNQDNEILDWAIFEYGKDLKVPEKIKVKEILCKLLSRGLGRGNISGVNDILRVVTYLSYGDTTLSPLSKWERKSKRIKLTNPQRTMVMDLLEDYLSSGVLDFKIQDAKKYRGKWTILGQVLHVSSKKYWWTRTFFDSLTSKDGRWKENWGSSLQKAYDKAGKDGSLKGVIDILSRRPGEFLRRYDSVLRKAWDNKDAESLDYLQTKFIELTGITPKTIFELHKYYDRRNMEASRSYVDKSGVRHMYTSLSALDNDLILLSQAVLRNKLMKIWGESKDLEGKRVYINIPTGEEFSLTYRGGTTDSIKSVLPGHKEYFEKKGMIRFFTQWIDEDGTQDLDLHAWLVDEDYNLKAIGFDSSFTDDNGFISHSGDVRMVKGDCAEFVTVDFSKTLPYKWLLITVNNYNGPRLSDLENYLGMSVVTGEESKTRGGEWVPTENNLIFRTRVISEARNIAGYIVNLEEGYIRFILEGLDTSIFCNHQKKVDIIKQYITSSSFDLREILSMWVSAKGGICISEIENPEEDVIKITLDNVYSGEVNRWLFGE